MQLKYIVYYTNTTKLPQVDIWKTTGELIHPEYTQKHNIKPQDISSQGYVYFNPLFKKWFLEHYQMDDGVPAKTLGELIQKKRIEKRDRLLVRKKLYQTDFFNDVQLRKETWQDRKSFMSLYAHYLVVSKIIRLSSLPIFKTRKASS